ncbi:hypothetical protein FLO80_21445 [Aquicoccus porphyridii]|uniref:Uncharacterized protein n=1 Tax=Aquicoccus porphyridii TaxID=1852029 RepID=A0A5A9YXB7_9RHOB|nr:hypothetical protein [Aquicoccus porphyridii]KAA0909477.1 hypothetical protein FLO80_21445 [Aquicoccus porphyridii]
MSAVFSALKGSVGLRLTEKNIISLLGTKYSAPARSPIKTFWDIGVGVGSDEERLRYWRHEILGHIISKIAAEPSGKSQRRTALAQLVSVQESIAHRGTAYNLQDEYLPEVLADYPNAEDAHQGIEWKKGRLAVDFTVLGAVHVCLLDIVSRGFGADWKKIEAQMDVLRDLHEMIVKFKFTLATLHTTDPITFDQDAALVISGLSEPVVRMMRSELSVLEQATVDGQFDVPRAQEIIERMKRMRADFMRERLDIHLNGAGSEA